jgi:hypothetical protein
MKINKQMLKALIKEELESLVREDAATPRVKAVAAKRPEARLKTVLDQNTSVIDDSLIADRDAALQVLANLANRWNVNLADAPTARAAKKAARLTGAAKAGEERKRQAQAGLPDSDTAGITAE